MSTYKIKFFEPKRSLFRSKNIYCAFRPIHIIAFWHGLTPIWPTKNGEDSIKSWLTVLGFLNQSIHICCYCGIYILSLMYHESVDNYFYRTGISRIVNNIRILCGLVSSVVMYSMAVIQCRKLPKILKIFNSLDSNFLQLNDEVKYNAIHRFTIIVICVVFFIIGSYFIGVYLLLRSMCITPSPIVCVQFYLQHGTLFLSIYMFCCTCKEIERRLVFLQKVRQIQIAQQNN